MVHHETSLFQKETKSKQPPPPPPPPTIDAGTDDNCLPAGRCFPSYVRRPPAAAANVGHSTLEDSASQGKVRVLFSCQAVISSRSITGVSKFVLLNHSTV